MQDQQQARQSKDGHWSVTGLSVTAADYELLHVCCFVQAASPLVLLSRALQVLHQNVASAVQLPPRGSATPTNVSHSLKFKQSS